MTFVIAMYAVFNMRMRSTVSPSTPSSTIVTFPCCRCNLRIIGPRDEDDECLIVYEDILKQWVPVEVGERLGLMDQLAHYPTNVAIVPWVCIVVIVANISMRSICTLAGSVIASR